MDINHAENYRFPLPGILHFLMNSFLICRSHKLTLEHIREYDSENHSKNANKTSILEGSS